MKYLILILLFISFGTFAQNDWKFNFPKETKIVNAPPSKEKVWVFIMAGQSNMAGRGFVSPTDTLPNERILSINAEGQLIQAKEPLHWYEPPRTGLDCGLSFARTILQAVPEDVLILMIPTAIGGSSIYQWLEDRPHHEVPLMTNFKEKVTLAKSFGMVKGILWHQGETNANGQEIPKHAESLKKLMQQFRTVIDDQNLPVFLGQLGSYSENDENWQGINEQIEKYIRSDPNANLILTGDLPEKGDKIHFNAMAQREMGRRFAEAYLQK
ncbi:sialate O-acetylesterase [Jiulongibacter sediminis]|jgi:hypothetical protein|uniref:sialate O-acetylesterase n=1 Tax=Jiulongibacter sediminis TaxID=1605367 RepID=UPI0026ECF81B|nr:sialate O-acetylesterase [Jiulongibacter sediminis]